MQQRYSVVIKLFQNSYKNLHYELFKMCSVYKLYTTSIQLVASLWWCFSSMGVHFVPLSAVCVDIFFFYVIVVILESEGMPEYLIPVQKGSQKLLLLSNVNNATENNDTD